MGDPSSKVDTQAESGMGMDGGDDADRGYGGDGGGAEAAEERAEAQLIPAEEAIREARSLLRARTEGVLCTISKRVAGWPFGSVAPYALGARGEPILYISTIAEHTKNIKADE